MTPEAKLDAFFAELAADADMGAFVTQLQPIKASLPAPLVVEFVNRAVLAWYRVCKQEATSA